MVETNQQQTYETLEFQALVETMNALDDYLSEEAEKDTSVSGLEKEQVHQAKQDVTPSPKNRLYMGLDGVYIGEVRKKKHIEAKVGIVFTDLRANISKGRNLLLNKQYVGTFHESDKFSEKLFCCATEMGVNDSTELIILGDGARWITKIAQTQYPKATLILDWWHLKERVWETIDYLKQTHLSQRDARKWGRRLIHLLWRGKTLRTLKLIAKLGKQLKIEFPSTAQQRRQLDERSLPNLYQYIKNNQQSIVNYRAKKAAGYFVSSVFAEKAIDVLVCRRQKLRGMNWTRTGAEDILIFRQLILNDQWQDYWQQKKAA